MIYQYPFKGRYRMTCEFGRAGKWKAGFHTGVDIVGDDNKMVYPIAEGVVQSINAHGKAYGNHIEIKHPDGMVSLYAHLENILVKKYDKVLLETPLGKMGATGNVRGAHLHLEVHKRKYKYPDCPLKECDWLVNPIEQIEKHKKNNNEITVLRNGKEVVVEAVNVDGNNYIKLRDLNKLFDVNIGFEKGMPIIDDLDLTNFKAYDYDYKQTKGEQVIATHKIRVWEVHPKLLKAAEWLYDLNEFPKKYVVNAGYGWWNDKTHKQPYGLSILVSDGKILCNAVPHQEPCGTVIVYNDNSVEIKQVDDITKEKNVRFAVGGMSVAPRVASGEEGFTGVYSDVLRECPRVVIGYNQLKKRIVIAGYNKMSAVRARDLLNELGCRKGITLDGGGSALMKENGEYILKTDGRTQFGCVYVDI